MTRRLLLACLTLAIGGIAIPAALAAPPATMTGEKFFDGAGGGTTSCSTSGTSSFTSSGVATGPYAGTFTETGTATVSQPPHGLGTVTGFSATFTVYSPSGDVLVTGSKSFDPTIPSGFGCRESPSHVVVVSVQTTYEATIYTSAGNYRDEGTSLVGDLFTNGASTLMDETFLSSLLEPVLIAPTTKEQCKNGGWMNYPQFKNQGDCVSFVNNGK
jgi:uncharacterized membrane protein